MARPDAAQGRLDGDAVLVPDAAAANRLHNRGGHGTPVSGGGLRLHPVEAAHLVESGRLEVDGVAGVAGLLLAFPGSDVPFVAYRDLRERGLLVRPEDGGWTVWPRAATAAEAPWFRLHAAPERAPLAPGDLLERARREDVVSVVDEDGTLTHYRLRPESPTGALADGPPAGLTGTVLEDRVLVPADAPVAPGVGTPLGDVRALSFTEAEHLRRAGGLRLLRHGEDVGDGFAAWAAGHQHHFSRTLPVYQDLRGRGVLPRSGFRFGTHLRAYPDDPDRGHAPWLLQCVRPDDALHWSEVSRAVRLAHGVRKMFCLAVVQEGGHVDYVALQWFRP